MFNYGVVTKTSMALTLHKLFIKNGEVSLLYFTIAMLFIVFNIFS